MREDIKKIYLADTWTYDGVMGFEFDESESDRVYYVYEWHTSTGKTFYIGKGKGKRYAHIIKEIEAYEKNPRKYKGQNYKILRDTYGIDYSILMGDLTECEAIIMENYCIIQHLSQYKPLLNRVIPCLPEEVSEWWYTVCNKNVLELF